jgi:virginiamycin B lyase
MVGPTSIAASPFGTLWYVNWPLIPPGPCNWSIGRITTKGASTCFRDPKVIYPQRIVAGPDSAMWFTIGGMPDGSSRGIGRISKTGAITVYPLAHYADRIALGSDRALWFTYSDTNAIGRITTTGALSSFTDPSISDPRGIAAGPDGALWFLNAGNNTIDRITTKGQITSYRGPFGLTVQSGITAGPDGAMWFTNPANNTIGRITTTVTPAIFTKTPASGPPGTQVTITGRNLRHATQVAFNGTPATIITDAATYIVAVVPRAATTGRISITTPAGTASQNGWFTVTEPTAHIR